MKGSDTPGKSIIILFVHFKTKIELQFILIETSLSLQIIDGLVVIDVHAMEFKGELLCGF